MAQSFYGKIFILVINKTQKRCFELYKPLQIQSGTHLSALLLLFTFCKVSRQNYYNLDPKNCSYVPTEEPLVSTVKLCDL